MSGIFISYRREDSAVVARRLLEQLSARFGSQSVFIDVVNIETGDNFTEVIREKVGFCDVLIAVIGKQWLTIADPNGHRRLDDPDDWVRLEIAAALSHGTRVIPVLVDGAALPNEKELPPPLSRLPQFQKCDLRQEQFEQDVESKLSAVLEQYGRVRKNPAAFCLSLITRGHRALDPSDLGKPEVLRQALLFLLSIA